MRRVFVHALGESDVGADSAATLMSPSRPPRGPSWADQLSRLRSALGDIERPRPAGVDGSVGLDGIAASRPVGVAATAAAGATEAAGRAVPAGGDGVSVARDVLLTPVRSLVRDWQRMPLEVLLDTFTADDVLLLAATQTGHPKDTAPLFELVTRVLHVVPDLYGPPVRPEEGQLLRLPGADEPRFDTARTALSAWLSAHPEFDEVVIGVGSGATGLAIGFLIAALGDGRPVHVRPTQPEPSQHLGGIGPRGGSDAGSDADAGYPETDETAAHRAVPGDPGDPGETGDATEAGEPARGKVLDLRVAGDPWPWLARRRMFGGMAMRVGDTDPDLRDLLRLLDARQRLDIARFRTFADRLGVPSDGPLAPNRPEALEGAFFDRLVRREVQAVMLGRAWLVSEYRRLRTAGDPPPPDNERLGDFFARVERYPRSTAVGFVLANRWVNRRATRGMATPTRADLLATVPAARAADARDPRRRGSAVASRLPDLRRWSSTASGEVLVVYCVGLREEQDGRRPFADALLADKARARITGLIEPPGSPTGAAFVAGLRVMLVGSGQTIDAARESARYLTEQALAASGSAASGSAAPGAAAPGSAAAGSVAAGTAAPGAATAGTAAAVAVGLGIAGIRATVAEALVAVPGVDDVEAVVVLVGPGTNPMNAGALLAGTDLATSIGCPEYVGAMVWHPARGTTVELFPNQVAAFPGYPDLLAAVAAEHLADLELTAAADTLRRAGARLAGLAKRAECLRAALVRECPPGVDPRQEAARRIELVKALVETWRAGAGRDGAGRDGADGQDAGRAEARPRAVIDEWHALHLAMTVTDRVMPGEGWYRIAGPASRVAYHVRNRSVTAHGTELTSFVHALKAAQPRRQVRIAETCRELLTAVQNELDPAGHTGPGWAGRRALRRDYDALTCDVLAAARNDTSVV